MKRVQRFGENDEVMAEKTESLCGFIGKIIIALYKLELALELS